MKKFLLIIACSFAGTSLFGQTTWHEIPTGTNKKLTAIDFPSNNVGYIVGEDSTLLKSINGGQTWQQLTLNGISVTGLDDSFTDVDFIDENIGFVVMGYSGTYKTLNGGQSWQQVLGQTSNMCFPYAVFPFAQEDFFVGGAGCFEGAIVDHYQSGSWTTGNLGMNFWDSNQSVIEMSFSGNTRGLAATRSEYMLRTVDGGITWDTISTGISDVLTSVFMVNDTLCYAGYMDPNAQGYGVLKSEDGGLTWEYDFNSATFLYPNYLAVHAADNGDVYAAGTPFSGSGGIIFELTTGTVWDHQSLNQPINDLTSYGADITFGVGDNGYLIVNIPVAELSVSPLDEVEFEVYPNPFQDEIIIINPLNKTMNVSIVDVHGRVVRSEELHPGNNLLNLQKLNQGIYFLAIKQDNSHITKRIIKQ